MSTQVSETDVLGALRPIMDPDFNKSIVELGFIKQLRIDGVEAGVEHGARKPANLGWCRVVDHRPWPAHPLDVLGGDRPESLGILERLAVGVVVQVSHGQAIYPPALNGLVSPATDHLSR